MRRILQSVIPMLGLAGVAGLPVLTPEAALAQDAPDAEAPPPAAASPWFSAPGVAVVAGTGAGPEDVSVGAAGLLVRVPVWSVFAVTGEFTFWSLDSDAMCPADPDTYSFACEYRGTHHIKLLGVEATLALGDRLEVSGAAAGGHWNYPSIPNTRSVEGRARLRLLDGLHASVGARSLRVLNPNLEEVVGEPIQYRLYAVAVEYRVRLRSSPDAPAGESSLDQRPATWH